MVPDRIEREIDIDAPIERVWALVTQGEHLGAWFGDAGASVDLRPGGAVVLTWAKHGSYRGVVEKVERPRFFAVRWSRKPDVEPQRGNSTLVEFILTGDAKRTRLKVVESGWRELDLSDDARSKAADENRQGWVQELDELQAYAQKVATPA
jgi:uncharacterized protein YndB with AHSA1/START domain